MDHLSGVRDRVLDNAALAEGETLLDVGCGDGLIGFGALERRAVFEEIQPPDRDPMLNFDERDLVLLAEQAGFQDVYLQLEFESKPPRPRPWETFLRIVGNPKIPSFGEAWAVKEPPPEASSAG